MKKHYSFHTGFTLSLTLFFNMAFSLCSFGQQYYYGTGIITGNPTITGGMTTSGNNVTVTSSGNIPGGTYNFANLTINTGVVLTATGTTPIIIRCTGTFTLNGVINAVGGTASAAGSGGSGSSGGAGIAGGANGGNGGNTSSGTTALAGSAGGNFNGSIGGGTGGAAVTSSGGQAKGGGGGGYGAAGSAAAGGAAGGAAYNTATLSTNVTNSVASVPVNGPATTIYLCGGSGGAGGGASNASILSNTYPAGGGGGGGGGGMIQVTANTIAIGSQNPAISVAGGAGGKGYKLSAGAYGGGGGGGAGGTIDLQYFNYSNGVSADANLVISGGALGAGGSTSAGNGGAGAVGRLYKQADITLCTQPSSNVTNLSSAVISGTQVNVTFTRGSGTGGVIVIARTTATTEVAPTQSTAYTTTTFGTGSGSQLTGAGNYVVYNSNTSGNITVPVTGLTANTPYTFDVYEYNSTGPCYFTPGSSTSNTPTSCTPPGTQASGFSTGSITNNSMVVSWTGNGSGAAVIVVGNPTQAVNVTALQMDGNAFTPPSNPVSSFTGTQIGSTGNYVLYVGTGSSVTLNNLTAGATYYYAVYTFDNVADCYNLSTSGGNSGSATVLNPTTYTSSAASIPLTTSVTPSTTNNEVLELQIVAGGGTTPTGTINSITTAITGSTSATDITNVRIWYTGTSGTFATTTQYGSTEASPGTGNYTFTGSQTLSVGTNYFWVTYDIAATPTATLGDVVTATLPSFNITDYAGTSNQSPSNTTPSGSRTILLSYCTISNSGVNACTSGQNYGIGAVYFNGGYLYNNPGTCISENYGNFTSTNSRTVTAGATYTDLTVTRAINDGYTNYASYVAVWVDWNNDGVFTDANDNIMPATQYSKNTATNTAVTFTVPSGASVGAHVMRVGDSYSSPPTSCSGNQDQFFDFTVNVLASCTAPTQGATWQNPSGTTTSQTNISFTRGNGTGGVIVVAHAGSAVTGGPVSGTSYSAGSTFTGSSCQYGGTGASTVGNGYVVYTNAVAGDDATVITTTVTGLTSGTTYYFSIYEFNATTNCYTLTGATGNVAIESPCSGTPTAGTAAAVSSTLCANGSTTINLTGYTTGVGSIVFQWQQSTDNINWSPVSGGSGATTTSYTTPALANSGTSAVNYYYQCAVTCQTGPATAYSNTVTIAVNPSPKLTINGSNTYSTSTCNTVGVALAVSDAASDGGATYSWSPNSTISPNNTAASVTVTPATTTTYTVTGTANSCTASATAAITVNPGTISFNPVNPSVAIGGGVSITATSTSGNGTPTYAWTPNDGTLSSQTGATVSASPLSAETYTVVATDANSCSRSATVTVNVTSGTPGLVSCGYSFSTGSSFSAITGTSLGSAGSYNYTVDLSSLSPAFNFDFNGVTYNKFGVNGNGFIWLGNTAPAATTTSPISDGTISVDGIISAWGESLSIGTSSNVSYAVSGTSPNRTLTVYWYVDFQPGGFTNYSIQAEAILYENNPGGANSNKIQFSYANQTSEITNESGSIEIGLRGATNADYNNRYEAQGGSMSSTSTSAGTANSSTVNFNAASDYIQGNILWTYTPTITTPTITPTGTQTVTTCGSGVVLTGNSTLPSSPTTWAWLNFANGNPAPGTNNASTYTANPTTPGDYYYAVKVTNAAGCSRTSSAEAVVATTTGCCTTNTWQGGTATGGGPTDWFTGANWSCGTVPTSTNNVLIPGSLSNYPVISGSSGITATAQNLTIASGASLNVLGVNNVNLEIYGDFTNNGSSALGAGKILAKATGAVQHIYGTNSFTNLVVDNPQGVIIDPNASVNVSGTLSLQSGTLTTNGKLTITSTASATGLIDDFTNGNGGAISGNITVQRYVVNPGASFYFIGAPVTGANISNWSGFTNSPINGASNGSAVVPTASCSDVNLALGSPYGGLFEYEENSVTTCNMAGWHTVFSGTAVPGEGYAAVIPNGSTISLTGGFNTGSTSSPTITYSAGNHTETEGFGWNLVANPYASPVELLDVFSGNTQNLSGTAYTYITSGIHAGTYNPVNSLTGGGQIGSSEAVWVEATSASTNVTFSNSMRRNGTNSFLRTKQAWEQMLTLNVDGNGYNDLVRVAFGGNFTNGYDKGYDAHKLMNRAVQPNVFVTDNVAKYSIYAIPAVTQNEKDIPMSFTAGTSGQFSFTADLNSFDPTALVFLEDQQTHTVQNLMLNPSYTFTSNVSDDPARFVLHFMPAASFSSAPADCNGQNGMFVANMGQYSVAGMPLAWTTYTLTASDNSVVSVGNLQNNAVSFANLASGSYTLQLNMNGYSTTKEVQVTNKQQVAAAFVPNTLQAHVGDDVLFANNSTGATGYSWQFGDGAISDAVSPTHTYSSAGSYQVVLTANNPDCSGTFEKTVQVESTTGINNVHAQAARITGYANEVNIEFTNFTSLDEVTVNIYDVTGRKLITPQNISTGDSKHTIQMEIVSGYYFVVLTGKDYEKAEKVFLSSNR